MPFLFEHLTSTEETCPGQPATFDLKTAVAAQIGHMVSARPLDLARAELDVLGFGMPSIVELATGNRAQLDAYAARLLRLIRHYEPRLLEPAVALEPAPGRLTPYRVVVTGMLAPDSDLQVFRVDLSDH